MTIDWTQLIIGLCGIVLTIFVAPYIKMKWSQLQDESVEFWLRTLMSAAETYFATGTGKEKKQWVLDEMQKRFPKLDIAILDSALESMFRELVIEGIINNDEINPK